MRCKGLHGGTVALALALQACGGMKDAGSVADKFVDRYYVESDQDGALPLTIGVASMRLKDELKLTREGRQGNPGMQLRPRGDEITVHVLQANRPPPPKPPEAFRQDFKVLYEDEHILAVDKPVGLAIHPGSGITGETLVDQVRGYLARQGLVTPEGEFK